MKTILVDAAGTFIVEDKDNYKIFKEMQDLLDSFKTRKIILTGANVEQFKKYGLDNMPYEVFTLKHNPEKTDPKYFKTMLKQFGLNKDEVLYIEHDPEAVKSARSVGITSHQYDPDKKDLVALKSFLDKNIEFQSFQKHKFMPTQQRFEKRPVFVPKGFSTPRKSF